MAQFGGLRRRQPVQERSRRRVERMLTAAMELLETGGDDAVTTRAIAERAEVPVATVYQFFPNRNAIIQELLLDHLNQRDAQGAAVLADLAPASVTEAVHAVFEFHRDYLSAHPNVVTLFYSTEAAGVHTVRRQLRGKFADAMHAALVDWGLIAADTDPLVTLVAIEIGDRVLELAFHSGPDRHREVLAEGERAVTGYLERHAPAGRRPRADL